MNNKQKAFPRVHTNQIEGTLIYAGEGIAVTEQSDGTYYVSATGSSEILVVTEVSFVNGYLTVRYSSGIVQTYYIGTQDINKNGAIVTTSSFVLNSTTNLYDATVNLAEEGGSLSLETIFVCYDTVNKYQLNNLTVKINTAKQLVLTSTIPVNATITFV